MRKIFSLRFRGAFFSEATGSAGGSSLVHVTEIIELADRIMEVACGEGRGSDA